MNCLYFNELKKNQGTIQNCKAIERKFNELEHSENVQRMQKAFLKSSKKIAWYILNVFPVFKMKHTPLIP